MSATMTRWETEKFGVSNLRLAEVVRPKPGPGEILIRVEAVSLNFRDIEVLEDRMGYDVKFPFSPTSDMAGTVVETGAGVARFAVGDAVVSMCITNWIDGAPQSWEVAPPLGGSIPGVLAQYIAIPADWCVATARGLSAVENSTLPIAGLTAWMSINEIDHVHAGQTVVVQGTGGVALFAIQFAQANGANVIVTSSGPSKAARLREMGVQHIIDRREHPDWSRVVMEMTNGKGADHILELAAGENLRHSLDAVKFGGHISLIGFLESYETSMSVLPVLGKRVKIEGISVGPRRAMEDMIAAMSQNAIKPVIEGVYSWDRAAEAFAHLARGAFGKIVIEVSH